MITSLTDALPAAEFVEHHSLVIDAPPERVWAALEQAHWSDLRLTRPLLLVRGFGRLGRVRLLDGGPVDTLVRRQGEYVAGGRIGRPWRLAPELGPTVASFDELAAFDEPGWLKFGMEFRLHPLRDGRTRLATSTLCEPTDADAGRRFNRYWRLIRPFSGLIRRELLGAVARRVQLDDPAKGPTLVSV